MIEHLLNVRQDKGAGGATPTDWHGKVITLVGKDFGHIYNCTIGVVKEKSYFANVISVDMRNILPQFANEKKRQGHSMYTQGNLLKNRNRCYNSWGN